MIELYIGDKWISIEGKHLLHDFVSNGESCMLMISSMSFGNLAVIGLPIFQQRYITHNMDSYYMEFGPIAGSNTKAVVSGDPPTRPISEAGKVNSLSYYSLLTVYLAACYALYFYQVEPKILSRSGFIGTRATRDSLTSDSEATYKIYLNYGRWAFLLFCIAMWQLYVSPLIGVYQPGLISTIFATIYNSATAPA